MHRRIILDTFGLITLLFGPWWIMVACLFFGAFIFDDYYELFILMAVYDIIYAPGDLVRADNIFFSIAGMGAYVAITVIKYNFNIHEKKVTRFG